MAVSIFSDKASQPGIPDLYPVLGLSASHLNEIETFLKNEGHTFDWAWKFYGKKAGWTTACVVKKRNIFHLIPLEGSFSIVFTFGQNAVEAALGADLSEKVKTLIQESPVYAEGRSFRLNVSNHEDSESAIKLIKIKLGH